MKASELMAELFAMAEEWQGGTCDTCKAGETEKEINKVAVAMFATPDVVREAARWGADLLIVHEPTYYGHMDEHSAEAQEREKRELIESTGITLYRYHDHTHRTTPDIIFLGQIKRMGLTGRTETTDTFGLTRFYPDEPVTPLELARLIEERCGIKRVRICGVREEKCDELSCFFGAPGGSAFTELKDDRCQILLIGEICEWNACEYARDAAQLGRKKAVLIMGHVGSERDGMVYTADLIAEKHPGLDVKYFECGEVYSYTDE